MKVSRILAGVPLLGNALASYNCSVATVQSLVNGVVDNSTTAVVAFAYRIDSNETLASFESLVGNSNLRSNLTDVCAIRVNVTTTAGSNYALGAFFPDVWHQRIL